MVALPPGRAQQPPPARRALLRQRVQRRRRRLLFHDGVLDRAGGRVERGVLVGDRPGEGGLRVLQRRLRGSQLRRLRVVRRRR